MIGYMFDTNIFNHILDGEVDISLFKMKKKFYVTHLQLDELNNTKDEIRRLALLKVFQQIQNIKVPTESAVWDVSKGDEAKFSDEETFVPTDSFVLGFSRLGMGRLSNGTLYAQILEALNKKKPKDKENNIKDTLIAETCIKNKFTLVTSDKALYEVAKEFNCNVLQFKELIKNN